MGGGLYMVEPSEILRGTIVDSLEGKEKVRR